MGFLILRGLSRGHRSCDSSFLDIVLYHQHRELKNLFIIHFHFYFCARGGEAKPLTNRTLCPNYRIPPSLRTGVHEFICYIEDLSFTVLSFSLSLQLAFGQKIIYFYINPMYRSCSLSFSSPPPQIYPWPPSS